MTRLSRFAVALSACALLCPCQAEQPKPVEALPPAEGGGRMVDIQPRLGAEDATTTTATPTATPGPVSGGAGESTGSASLPPPSA